MKLCAHVYTILICLRLVRKICLALPPTRRRHSSRPALQRTRGSGQRTKNGMHIW